MTDMQRKLTSEYDRIWLDHLARDDSDETVLNRMADRKEYYDIIQKYISRTEAPMVMEIGCGTGIDINLIKKRNRTITAVGSDISEKSIQVALKICRDFGNLMVLFVGDTLMLPLKSETVDILFSQGLVEHFKDPEAVIAEQVRVLRNGGILIVNVPQKYTGYTVMKKRLMREGKWALGWEKEFSYRDLKQIGNNLGLIEKNVFGSQYWKSWGEPAFVLRDLLNKIRRRTPLRVFPPFQTMAGLYNALWGKLETRWGHYFLKNIVIVFQKGTDENFAS
ncbi:MAG: class I SAM-dependent methyltransferase [Desulfobacterales bacterium]|nr:class I SAM-dependent methyltransferase [Desulfobacterales bacterium]